MHICCPGKVDASDNKRKNMSHIPGPKGGFYREKETGVGLLYIMLGWIYLHTIQD